MPEDDLTPKEVNARWIIARERAKRANRNLLQFGAAFTTTVGAFGGSAGILAIANAMQKNDATQTLILGLMCVGAGLFVIFFLGLFFSLLGRRRFEQEAERYLRLLVEQEPERFVQKESLD